MMIKMIGALCIVTACAGFGILISTFHKQEVNSLKDLISALDYMECELQFRMTALPDLCRRTAAECDGKLRRVFLTLSNELEDQIAPDVGQCMRSSLDKISDIPKQTSQCLVILGDSLGRFDLDGQLKSLESVRMECRERLKKLNDKSEKNLRSYQTLGICAGAALVILLM